MGLSRTSVIRGSSAKNNAFNSKMGVGILLINERWSYINERWYDVLPDLYLI